MWEKCLLSQTDHGQIGTAEPPIDYPTASTSSAVKRSYESGSDADQESEDVESNSKKAKKHKKEHKKEKKHKKPKCEKRAQLHPEWSKFFI